MQETSATTGRSVVSDKHCVFRVGSSWHSMLATSIREVTMTPVLVRVPGSDLLLAGLCHFRNEFIPVVDLNPLLENTSITRRAAGKMLVIGGAGGNWALLVDEVIALESLETLVHGDARSHDGGATAVLGTATFRDQVVRVLDPNTLYRRAEQRLRSGWSNLSQPLAQSSTASRAATATGAAIAAGAAIASGAE
ncbi:chemotaxis protein CheW [Candidatus Laterigemmans baculatus]|nr:chemotaxis protein CheW [Candidatus Laterigemmans baculatus]